MCRYKLCLCSRCTLWQCRPEYDTMPVAVQSHDSEWEDCASYCVARASFSSDLGRMAVKDGVTLTRCNSSSSFSSVPSWSLHQYDEKHPRCNTSHSGFCTSSPDIWCRLADFTKYTVRRYECTWWSSTPLLSSRNRYITSWSGPNNRPIETRWAALWFYASIVALL